MPEIIQADSQIILQLIENKLAAINTLLRDNQFTTRNDQTQGDLLSAVKVAIQDYVSAVKTSATTVAVQEIREGNINTSLAYNAFWGSVDSDLRVLYSEANNIGDMLVNHHNYIVADIHNILIQLKLASSQVENYGLLTSSPFANYQAFIEKFTDTSRLAIGSSLLSAPQANIDTIGGVATLAIKTSNPATQADVDSIITGSNSNGQTFGPLTIIDVINNSGLGLFQYEDTSSTFDTRKLTLDFTIKLKTTKILNFIRIVPNNFGTANWSRITAIDISPDGINFTSIRDQLLAKAQDDSEFTLAPLSSGYAGEGRYSFLPQRAMFVRFTIEQSTPYFDTNRGLFRWAIGLKDIELVGNTFESSSQIISAPYLFAAGVEKVAIDATELPDMAFSEDVLSSQAEIFHDISFDDGMSWKKISPTYVGASDPNAPELINVNNIDSQLNPTLASSINTTGPVTSLRYRIRMAANPALITDSSLVPYFSPVIRDITLKVTTQEVV